MSAVRRDVTIYCHLLRQGIEALHQELNQMDRRDSSLKIQQLDSRMKDVFDVLAAYTKKREIN